MKTVSALVALFVSDERGSSAIEYALLGGLIAMVVLGAISVVGAGTIGLFNGISDKASEALSNSTG